jgi:hypothetical protein
MSEYLKKWDLICDQAREEGIEIYMVGPEVNVAIRPAVSNSGYTSGLYWVNARPTIAKTMHPSFMQPKVPKHDPERDQ